MLSDIEEPYFGVMKMLFPFVLMLYILLLFPVNISIVNYHLILNS